MSSAPEKGRLHREIWGVVICLTALLIALSLISYSAADRSLNTPSGALDAHNWGGFIGAFLADLLLQSLGHHRLSRAGFSMRGGAPNVSRQLPRNPAQPRPSLTPFCS